MDSKTSRVASSLATAIAAQPRLDAARAMAVESRAAGCLILASPQPWLADQRAACGIAAPAVVGRRLRGRCHIAADVIRRDAWGSRVAALPPRPVTPPATPQPSGTVALVALECHGAAVGSVLRWAQAVVPPTVTVAAASVSDPFAVCVTHLRLGLPPTDAPVGVITALCGAEAPSGAVLRFAGFAPRPPPTVDTDAVLLVGGLAANGATVRSAAGALRRHGFANHFSPRRFLPTTFKTFHVAELAARREWLAAACALAHQRAELAVAEQRHRAEGRPGPGPGALHGGLVCPAAFPAAVDAALRGGSERDGAIRELYAAHVPDRVALAHSAARHQLAWNVRCSLLLAATPGGQQAIVEGPQSPAPRASLGALQRWPGSEGLDLPGSTSTKGYSPLELGAADAEAFAVAGLTPSAAPSDEQRLRPAVVRPSLEALVLGEEGSGGLCPDSGLFAHADATFVTKRTGDAQRRAFAAPSLASTMRSSDDAAPDREATTASGLRRMGVRLRLPRGTDSDVALMGILAADGIR